MLDPRRPSRINTDALALARRVPMSLMLPARPVFPFRQLLAASFAGVVVVGVVSMVAFLSDLSMAMGEHQAVSSVMARLSDEEQECVSKRLEKRRGKTAAGSISLSPCARRPAAGEVISSPRQTQKGP